MPIADLSMLMRCVALEGKPQKSDASGVEAPNASG